MISKSAAVFMVLNHVRLRQWPANEGLKRVTAFRGPRKRELLKANQFGNLLPTFAYNNQSESPNDPPLNVQVNQAPLTSPP